MKKTTNCLNCGSNNISLDIKLGQLKCNHCNSLVLEKKYQKQVQNITELKDRKLSKCALNLFKDSKKTIIKCETCGTIMHSRFNDKYTKCRICGSENLISLDKIDNNKVEYILPFSATKEDVMPILKHYIEKRIKHYNRGFVKRFKKENIIPMYIPCEISDIDYDCDIDAIGLETLKIEEYKKSITRTVRSSEIKRKMKVNTKGIYLANKVGIVNDLKKLTESIVFEDIFDTSERVKYSEDCFDDCYILDLNNKVDNDIPIEMIEKIVHRSLNEELMRYDRQIDWNRTDIKINKVKTSYIYLPVWIYIEKVNLFGLDIYQYVAANGRKLTNIKFNKIIDNIYFIDGFFSAIILTLFYGIFGKTIFQSIGLIPTISIILIIATIFGLIYNHKNKNSHRAQLLLNEKYKIFKSDIEILESEDNVIEEYETAQLSGLLNDKRIKK
ncbi:MAG: hypothetical protein IJ463_06505 [Bacilli bacterium]|nr:hypothetical protein [Bacilli bacterium]